MMRSKLVLLQCLESCFLAAFKQVFVKDLRAILSLFQFTLHQLLGHFLFLEHHVGKRQPLLPVLALRAEGEAHFSFLLPASALGFLFFLIELLEFLADKRDILRNGGRLVN